MYSVYRGTRYRANIGLYFGRGNPGSQQNLEVALRSLDEWGIGIGASLLQTKSVHLGVNFTAGARFTGNKTIEDFENDVFQTVVEYKLNFEASFFF